MSTSAPASLPTPLPAPSMRRRILGWVREGVVMLLVFVGVSEVMARVRAPDIALQQSAPVTHGVTLDGAPFDLNDFAGRPVFLNMWATWCGPCRAELPDLAEAASLHPEVQFVGLTMGGSDPAQARTLTQQAHVTYPIVLVPRSVDAAWGVTSFPSSVLLDGNGHVVWRRAGALSVGAVGDALKLLKE